MHCIKSEYSLHLRICAVEVVEHERGGVATFENWRGGGVTFENLCRRGCRAWTSAASTHKRQRNRQDRRALEDACHVSYEEEDACHVSYEEEDAYLQPASEGTNGHAQQADKKKYHKKNIIIPAASIRRNKSSCAASGSPSSGPQHTPNKFSTISVLVQFFSKIRVLVYPVSIQCMCVWVCVCIYIHIIYNVYINTHLYYI
jgi:hypothetical protein